MDMSELLFAVRRQISDTEKSFLQTIQSPGGTDRYVLEYAPVRAESVQVHVDSVDVSPTVAVEEHTGTIIFDVPPSKNQVIAVSGIHFRFFTDAELEKICQDAFEMHTASRTDIHGRVITLKNLAPLEDLPLQILCAIQALYVLLTDASYDIDINAPDGVNIPRSERFRQLFEMLQTLEARYRELSAMLNVGMYALEVFTFRRISKRTNRYVPVWRPQEIDDRSVPQRVVLPIPTYGGQIIDDGIPDYDITLYRGDTFREIVRVETPIPVEARLLAQIKRFKGSSVVVDSFDVLRLDEYAVLLQLPADRSQYFPERMVWDLQMTVGNPEGDFNAAFSGDFEQHYVKTLVAGTVIVPKDVTIEREQPHTPVTPINTGAAWVPAPHGYGT